jgi:hypothetical protein
MTVYSVYTNTTTFPKQWMNAKQTKEIEHWLLLIFSLTLKWSLYQIIFILIIIKFKNLNGSEIITVLVYINTY